MGIFEKVINYFAPGEEEVRTRDLGRNDDCWCGSGRKYKKCHLGDDETKARAKSAANCGRT